MVARILGIVLPVVLIIAVGYLYGRRARPDLRGMNQALLELLAPFLVLSAFTSRNFSLAEHLNLLLCCVIVVLGSGLLSVGIARLCRVEVKTFVPPMMFNNCGNMGLSLAVLNFLLAERYQQEPDKVASIVLLGNILALVWVPLGLVLGLR